MISADNAISRARWDRVRSIAIRFGVAVIGAVFVFYGAALPVVILAVIAIWVFTGMRSAYSARSATAWPMLIAAGQYEEAERQIQQALESVATLRSIKLLGLHYLAMLRHAQRRFGESAKLSRAVLGQKRLALRGVSKQAQLVLADSLLELNDLSGAAATINALVSQPLNLGESLNLLLVQTNYLAHVQAWDQMLYQIHGKAMLTEVMPGGAAARTVALLALAAKKADQSDWEQFLRRRAELLADIPELIAWHAGLAELWQ